MDDHGIVDFTSSDSMETNPPYAGAIANLDIDNPHIDDHDPGCLLVSFDCKNGAQCVRQGIAAFYPDGQGEIHNR